MISDKDLTDYTVVQLRSALKHLNLRTSGSKAELVLRLREVDINLVNEALAMTEDANESAVEDAEYASKLEDEVSQLRVVVQQLCQQMKALRSAETVNQPGSASPVAQRPTIAAQPREEVRGNTQQAASSQVVNAPTVSVTPAYGQTPRRERSTPSLGLQSVQSSTYQYSMKDITAVLPVFDPADDTQTSMQFVERIERLKAVYGWNDHILVFAVMSKFKGYAKRWVDAQPVFENLSSFVVAFLRDFPYVRTQANAHIQLMKARMNKGEKLIEFYYRVLSLGRRENIDEDSIIQYIINGITDEHLKRTLNVMHFDECAELLKAMLKIPESQHSQQTVYKRTAEVVHNRNVNEQDQKRESKVTENHVGMNRYVCYNCHQRGHMARNCKQTQRKRNSNNVNNMNVEVENAACSAADDDEIAETSSTVNKVNDKTTKELLKKIHIVGEVVVECNALIDSGSNRSLIRESIAKEIGCEMISCKETLLGFAGGVNTCLQKAKVKIKIDDSVHDADLLVVHDDIMSYDMIIGLDVLSQGILIIENGTCKMMSIHDGKVEVEEKLEKEEKKSFYKLLAKYNNCFGEKLHELGKSKTFRMKLELTSEKPVFKKPYNIPIPKRVVVEKIIEELLELGIVRPSSSLYASPIVLVRKQNGEDRMCVDFRQLNAITEQQPWCMPTVDGVLTNLKGHKYFTTLDLLSGYYQIELDENSKRYTGFVTHRGHYEFNRMPFGLRNAPCVFQKMMSELLQPMGDHIVSYVDEIIIATNTVEEHLTVLEKFLKIMQNEGLTLRISKCRFLQSVVSFLGHVIDGEGIRPGHEKTLAIQNYPVPKNTVDVRRFLGLTGFFRKFVQNYAHIAKPITELMKKDVSFIWSDDCNRAFQMLIEKLINKPILAIYDVNKQHELHTDASSIGLAAILLQADDEGKLHAVAYFSRCCNNAERNYHAYELEVLAIVEACDRFRMYLLGKTFKIVTDCESITTAKMSKPLIPRVARWFLRMQEYDFQIVHRPGDRMKHVDALSRAPAQECHNQVELTPVMNINTDDWVSIMQRNDANLKNIVDILMGNVQSEHKRQIEAQYVIKNGRLYFKTTKTDPVLVVPKGLRWRIIKMFHDDVGHPAVENVLKKACKSFWFPRMRNFVKSYIKSCVECAYHQQPKRKGCELHGMDVPQLPFEVMHLDHLDPFIKSKKGFEYVLVCVDALTRYVLIYPTRTTKTKPVIDALNQMTMYFGTPKTLVTDRGTAFTAGMFAAYCNENSIQHIKVAVRTPRSNGLAERVNQSVLMYLRTSTADKREWDENLRSLQWTINTRVNATTKFSPIDLVFDFPLRDINGNKLLAALHDDVSFEMNARRQEARNHVEQARTKWKARFDAKHGKPLKYFEGDLVVVESPAPSTGQSRKLEPKYKGPFIVTKVLRYDRYVVEYMVGSKRSQRAYSAVLASDKMKPFCALFPEVDESVNDDDEDDNGSYVAEDNSGRT